MSNMELINKVTVGAGGASSIDFTSIPQTYTDLRVVLSTRLTSTGGTTDTTWLYSVNGNTSSFTDRVLRADGSSASSFVPSETPLYIGQSPTASGTTSTFASHSVYIPNYSISGINKSISVDSAQENNLSTAYTGFTAGIWAQTDAITSLSFTTNSGNFAQYTTAYLYGITSANYGAKATGGVISYDTNYFYHTFYSSGTFTPTQSLTADYLVVAGGGSGGGQNNAGGGGAGGLRSTVTATGGGGSLETALSLTAQGYTVTVGAGGAATTSSTGNNGSNSVFSTITSTGGGGGGGQSTTGIAGGSGGGSAYAGSQSVGGSGTTNQGYAGGAGTNASPAFGGGGGGGAGAAGQAGTSSYGGTGGNGIQTTMATSGISTYYAGGGGGGGGNSAPGSGGTGGGGTGATSGGVAATAGTANTGSGGGGCQTSATTGANGGSGIVIVRYAK